MSKDATAWFVKHKIAKRLISRDEVALFPKRVAGRRIDSADNHVADFAFCVTADNVNGSGSRQSNLARLGQRIRSTNNDLRLFGKNAE